MAEAYAQHYMEIEQRQYAHNYNLRTRPKKFTVGQDCLIFQQHDTSSKMFSHWKGVKVIEVM